MEQAQPFEPTAAPQTAAPTPIPGLTKGRMVHFLPALPEGAAQLEEQAAVVAKVWTADGVVNLTVFSLGGTTYPATSVPYDASGTQPCSWRFIPRA